MNIEHICKNCNQSFNGSYCNSCGQKVANRLSTGHILHEIVHVFTHTDKGIFALVPTILFRPGHFALAYVEGKRKRYFSIFQYLILLVGVVTFLMAKSNYLENLTDTLGPTTGGQKPARVQMVQQQMMSGLQQYMNLVLFALLPVYAVFTWLLFKAKKYNYAENFVLQTAIQAQINTYILLLIIPLAFVLNRDQQKALLPISILLFLICMTVAYKQFFKISWLQAFVKGIVVYLLTNLIQLVLTAIITVILIINYKK